MDFLSSSITARIPLQSWKSLLAISMTASPREKHFGTARRNAGDGVPYGILSHYNSGAMVFKTNPASLVVHFSLRMVSRVTREQDFSVVRKSPSMSATASHPWR